MIRSSEDGTPVLDLRTYKLAPGGRGEFERIFREGALPMLVRYRIEVIGYGPSFADDAYYYLARAFPSVSAREEQLGSFYGSAEWKQNYQAVVAELIETYHTVVIPGTSGIAEELKAAATSVGTDLSRRPGVRVRR